MATTDGVAAVGAYEPLPTGDALIDYWRGRIGSGVKRAIFDVLVSAYPNAMAKTEVAEAIGASGEGGGFGARLSELKGLGLVEGSRELRAAPELFQ